MDSQEQAIFLLKVMINIAPIAVYFLVLGLLNSQAQPRIVSGQRDFVVLTLVFVPMLVWPVPFLVANGFWWLLLIGLAAAAGGFAALLPRRLSSWVMYNLSEQRCRRHLENALHRLQVDYELADGSYLISSHGLEIHISSFSVLRNVTLHFSFDRSNPPAELLEGLREVLQEELEKLALLPSASGVCLLALGVLLLMLPLWMINNHVDAVVEVITRLLFA
jgi:hypothetical protein